jgi:hypothetical protein
MADTFEAEQEQFLNTLNEETPAAVVETPEEEWFTTAQVAELRQQEREAAAAETKESLEAQFNERRGAIDANHNKALEALRAAGMDWNPKTGLAYVNPAQAMQTMFGGQAQQQQAKKELPPVEAWDPDSIKAYTAEIARQTREEVMAEVQPLINSLAVGQTNIMLPGALGQAAQFMAARGYAGAENTQEFRQAFNDGYRTLSLEQKSDPQVIRLIAGGAMASMPDEVLEKVRADAEKTRTETAAQAERDRQRAALGLSQTQGQPRGGNPIAEWQAGQNNQTLQNFLAAVADNPDVDRDMARALMAGTLANGQKAVDVLAAKRAREKAAKR